LPRELVLVILRIVTGGNRVSCLRIDDFVETEALMV
jgi:hypothetical protein